MRRDQDPRISRGDFLFKIGASGALSALLAMTGVEGVNYLEQTTNKPQPVLPIVPQDTVNRLLNVFVGSQPKPQFSFYLTSDTPDYGQQSDPTLIGQRDNPQSRIYLVDGPFAGPISYLDIGGTARAIGLTMQLLAEPVKIPVNDPTLTVIDPNFSTDPELYRAPQFQGLMTLLSTRTDGAVRSDYWLVQQRPEFPLGLEEGPTKISLLAPWRMELNSNQKLVSYRPRNLQESLQFQVGAGGLSGYLFEPRPVKIVGPS